MIVAENLKKSFKTGVLAKTFYALDDVSFEVKSSIATGFLGANGAGKTTFIKILFNFIYPDSGQAIFSSDLGKNKTEVLKKVGYLPERPYFYGDLSGEEFLCYLGGLSGLKRVEIKSRIPKLAGLLKIDHALKRKISSYSKGMLQRIGFLSAILHDPYLLILDEPMAGLDPLGRSEFKNLFFELGKQGKTLFFSSHIVSDIEEICQNLVVLQRGKLLFSGEMKTLMDKHFYEYYLLKANVEIDFLKPYMTDGYYKIKKEDKAEILKRIYAQNIEIDYLVPDTPSLEKVVYQLERNEF
jgi:ABC-2 type transport system ATP-binding protein